MSVLQRSLGKLFQNNTLFWERPSVTNISCFFQKSLAALVCKIQGKRIVSIVVLIFLWYFHKCTVRHIPDLLVSGVFKRLTCHCKTDLCNIRYLQKCLDNSISGKNFPYLAHFWIFFAEIYDQQIILQIIRTYRNIFRKKTDSVFRYFSVP